MHAPRLELSLNYDASMTLDVEHSIHKVIMFPGHTA